MEQPSPPPGPESDGGAGLSSQTSIRCHLGRVIGVLTRGPVPAPAGLETSASTPGHCCTPIAVRRQGVAAVGPRHQPRQRRAPGDPAAGPVLVPLLVEQQLRLLGTHHQPELGLAPPAGRCVIVVTPAVSPRTSPPHRRRHAWCPTTTMPPRCRAPASRCPWRRVPARSTGTATGRDGDGVAGSQNGERRQAPVHRPQLPEEPRAARRKCHTAAPVRGGQLHHRQHRAGPTSLRVRFG